MTLSSKRHHWIILPMVFFYAFVFAQPHWDLELLDKMNSAPQKGDAFMHGFSNSVTYVMLSTPVFAGGMAWKSEEEAWKHLAIQSAGSIAINGVITMSLKYGVARPRPFVDHGNIIYKKAEAGSLSFPSGHTSSAFQWATSCALACPKWYVVLPAYAYACGIGYSRLYLGVHYPSDVLAGAVVGSASAALSKFLTKKLLQRKTRPYR
jgi:membrane-associated phospholipid phosphatase